MGWIVVLCYQSERSVLSVCAMVIMGTGFGACVAEALRSSLNLQKDETLLSISDIFVLMFLYRFL
jgi:hypothetical protein